MFDKDYFKNYKEHGFKWRFWSYFIKRYTKKDDSILEIGCTYGFLFKYLKDYKNLYGIDISQYAIEQAKHISPNANFQIMNAESLKFKKEQCKLILAIDVIEHVKNPEKCIKECNRILNKEGMSL